MLEQECCGGMLAFTIVTTPDAVVVEGSGPQVAELLGVVGAGATSAAVEPTTRTQC